MDRIQALGVRRKLVMLGCNLELKKLPKTREKTCGNFFCFHSHVIARVTHEAHVELGYRFMHLFFFFFNNTFCFCFVLLSFVTFVCWQDHKRKEKHLFVGSHVSKEK